MPTNDFLPFATDVDAPVDSQAVWASPSGYRPGGYSSGILTKEKLNKALRQSTVIASAVAQVISDTLGEDVLDDGDQASLLDQAVQALSQGFLASATYRPNTNGRKLQEFPSFADNGASSSGDSTTEIQESLDGFFSGALDTVYSFSTPLKVPSLSHFCGKRPGVAFIGENANVKAALKKTTNTTVAIENFETHVVTTVDCMLYINPDWIDAGVSNPQKATLERLSLHGNTSPNAVGLYIEQGGDFRLYDVDIDNTVVAIRARPGVFGCTLSQVRAFGELLWEGGTSLHADNCRFNGTAYTRGGFDLRSLQYSVLSACATDNAKGTAYKVYDSSVVLVGSGCENADADLADHGTALHVDASASGNSNVLALGFDIVPKANQTIALMSVGRRSVLTVCGGTSYFPSIPTNCPDIYVFDNNSTVVIHDHVFLNGSRDAPVVQFKTGVTTSKVIVHYGTETKIYTSTGTGNTLVESVNDSGTYTPVISFGGTPAALGAGSVGRWQKTGKIINVSGRAVIQTMGAGTGVARLSGFPNFAPKGDVALNFSVINNLGTVPAGSQLVGTVTMGSGTEAVLSLRSNVTDTNATQTAFQVGTVLWWNMSYAVD